MLTSEIFQVLTLLLNGNALYQLLVTQGSEGIQKQLIFSEYCSLQVWAIIVKAAPFVPQLLEVKQWKE